MTTLLCCGWWWGAYTKGPERSYFLEQRRRGAECSNIYTRVYRMMLCDGRGEEHLGLTMTASAALSLHFSAVLLALLFVHEDNHDDKTYHLLVVCHFVLSCVRLSLDFSCSMLTALVALSKLW